MAIVQFNKFHVKFKGEDLGILDADSVTMDEALQLEDKTGMTFQQLISRFIDGSAKAIQAMVWFQLLRAGKPQELYQNFTFGDFDVEPVLEEEEAGPTGAADAADENPKDSGSDASTTKSS